jgi:phospholipid/cholesterol/gamma-HCH transport system substrate-binding protein
MTENNEGTRSRGGRRKAIAWAGLGLLGLIGFLGLRTLQSQSFYTILLFPDARGITRGMPVTYWGAKVGQVIGLEPEPNGVAVAVEIWPANRLIPRNSDFKLTRIEGEKAIDIQPRHSLPPEAKRMTPKSPQCDPKVLLCHNKQLSNLSRLSWRNVVYSLNSVQDINAEVQSIETDVNEVTSNVKEMKTTVKALGQLGQEVQGLLTTDKLNSTLTKLDTTLTSVQQAADNISAVAQKAGRLSDQATGLVENARQTKTIEHLNSSLVAVGGAADQVQVFMAVNRNNLMNTLASIDQLSRQVTQTVRRLDPLAERIQQSKMLDNLETISSNTAQLTTNLNQVSARLNDAQSFSQLQHILDAARSLLDNLNKITSDIDELTGNPRLRGDILRLIQGLSNLLSSTQLLQQQVAYGKVLSQVAAEGDRPKPLQP